MLAASLASLVACAGEVDIKMTFVHPGALNTTASLEFVKARISAGEQPWASEFVYILDSAASTRQPHVMDRISTDRDASIARDDALAAYTQALLWVFTGEEVYARRSTAILEAWSTFQGFNEGSDEDKLRAGWLGSVFAEAAEIMRSRGGLSDVQTSGLKSMFRRSFYPQLKTASTWNGNVDLTQIEALLAIAVFNEDQAEFKLGLARLVRRNPAYFFLRSDAQEARAIAGDGGNAERFWFNPVTWVDGLTQETCRDGGHHSQFGLGSALNAAEIAWNQGIDVYTTNTLRYTSAMELLASQLLTGNVSTCADSVATGSRYNTWEVGYNHYHNRQGLELPNTKKLIVEQIRTRSERASWNLVYETLTHAGFADNTGEIKP
jgi:hypothetical protein